MELFRSAGTRWIFIGLLEVFAQAWPGVVLGGGGDVGSSWLFYVATWSRTDSVEQLLASASPSSGLDFWGCRVWLLLFHTLSKWWRSRLLAPVLALPSISHCPRLLGGFFIFLSAYRWSFSAMLNNYSSCWHCLLCVSERSSYLS
jgi:hypothetical protein